MQIPIYFSVLRHKLFIAGALLAVFSLLLVSHVSANSSDTARNGRLITIHDRGNERVILTHAQTVRDALKSAGIVVTDGDIVEPRRDSELVATDYVVNIYRARPVVVVDGAVRQKIMTAAQTAESVATAAGMQLRQEDETLLAANHDMASDGASVVLTIDRATEFNLNLYGTPTTAYSQASTVGEMLKQKNITLSANDTLSVDVDAPLVSGMTVEIWRDGTQTATVEEPIDFPVRKIQDADRDIGYRVVQTPGVKGKKSVTYEIEMRNGKEIKRKTVQTITLQEPKEQVEVVGVKYPPVVGPAEILARIKFWSEQRGIDANRVSRIVKCESGFNPRADSGYYKGLFQHDPNYWSGRAAKYGAAGASIYDVEAQIKVSTAMMAGGGWSHWGCK